MSVYDLDNLVLLVWWQGRSEKQEGHGLVLHLDRARSSWALVGGLLLKGADSSKNYY